MVRGGGSASEAARDAYRARHGEDPPDMNGNGRHAPGGAVVGYPNTDLGNAERLTHRHGEDLRFSYDYGKYFVWDQKRWKIDNTGAAARKAKDTVRRIYSEATAAIDEATRKDLARHAVRSEAVARIDAMLKCAQSEEGIPITPNQLDADPFLLNVENGTLDLRSGELREHRREDLITKLCPVSYDPAAKCPVWERFLKRILPSEALRAFLPRVMGYCLTGDVSEQALFFFYGVGANGKSTLINIILEMLGDYGKQAAPELLTLKGRSHPTELADLKDARFVPSIEAEDGRRLAESLVKQLTGGDRIKARYMRQDFFEFPPTHKVILAANHKPVVTGTDHAIWRRIKLVPFEVTIPKHEQDPNLPEKLRKELPGILVWAVRGCLAWQREGLGEPQEVRAATEEYRSEMDALGDFIEECCVVGPQISVQSSKLYEAYRSWCSSVGETPETQKRFSMRLLERGFSKQTSGVVTWSGIGLRYSGPDNTPGGSDNGGSGGGSPDNPPKGKNFGFAGKTNTGDTNQPERFGGFGSFSDINDSKDSREGVMSSNPLNPPKPYETGGEEDLTFEECAAVNRLVYQGMAREFAISEVMGARSS